VASSVFEGVLQVEASYLDKLHMRDGVADEEIIIRAVAGGHDEHGL